MKAIILAAGKGERLKGVVDNVPKPMIEINGRPILEHTIEWLASFEIREIYINLHHLPDVIIDHFQDGSRWGVDIIYSKEPEILGTAGGVRRIARYWIEPFIVVYGDNLYPLEYNLRDFIYFHFKRKSVATIGLYEKGVCESGVVILEGDTVTEFIEKPSMVNAGIYILDSKVVDYIPEGFSDFGRDIFPTLGREAVVNGFFFKGQVVAIDTPELLRKVVK